MQNPWKNCIHEGGRNGFEGAVIKYERGIWSDETFRKWLNEHCEQCPFFASGEACVYGDIEMQQFLNIGD